MKKSLLLFLLGSCSFFIGCTGAKVPKEKFYEQVDDRGNHVKIYDDVKIVKNGNRYVINGIMREQKFTGTKEILLNSKGQKGSFNSPYYGVVLIETVEDDIVIARKYILETEITVFNSIYIRTLYKQNIVWAEIEYPVSSDKVGKIKVNTIYLEPENEPYSKLTGSNEAFRNAIHKFTNYNRDNSRIKARKKIIASYSGQTDDFILFDYYVSNKEVNTEALSKEEKRRLIEGFVKEQLEIVNEKIIKLNGDSETVETFLPDLQKAIYVRIQEEKTLKEALEKKKKSSKKEELEIYRDK